MPAAKVHALLDQHEIAYEVHTHARTVSAQRLAAEEDVSGWDVAKPVILAVGNELAMVVVSAAVEVDLDKARQVFGGNEVRLATEEEFEQVFADGERGAEPPFGGLYGIPVFLDERLRARPQLLCRDGSHTESLLLATNDYVRLVDPEIVDVAGTPA